MNESPALLLKFRQIIQRHFAKVFVALVILGIGIAFTMAIIVPHARDQSIAQKIEAIGGKVRFDFLGPEWIPQEYRNKLHVFDRLVNVEFAGDGDEVPSSLFERVLKLRHLKSLVVVGSQFGDRELELLKGNNGIADIRLYDTRVTAAGLEQLQGMKNLLRIHLSNSPIDDLGLKHLSMNGLSSLHELGLSGTNISDEGLEYLTGIGTLLILYLDNTSIGDDGLVHLKELTGGGIFGLQVLGLGGTNVGDAGLEQLKSLRFGTLNLRSTKITDKGLAHLGGITTLQSLDLSGTNIQGVGFVHLAELVNLEQLLLGATQTTDASIEYLTMLPKLKNLHLPGTTISDSGIKHLWTLSSLEQLNLIGAQTTAEGRTALRTALPNCKVYPEP